MKTKSHSRLTSEDPDKLRERIERYRSLLALNPDADARKIIDVLLKEAEEQLASVLRQPSQDQRRQDANRCHDGAASAAR